MAATLNPAELSTTWLDTTSKRRHIIVATATLLVSLAVARLVLMWDLGSVSAVLLVVGACAVAVQPRYGVYIVFCSILVFDATRSLDPLMEPGRYLATSLQDSLRLGGAVFTPLEMFLLVTTTLWLAHAAVRRRIAFRAGALGLPVALFAAALIFGIGHGLATGAVLNYVLWETRWLVSMVLIYVLTVNMIRTPGHLRALTAIMVIGAGLSALEGVWRKFALADTGLLGPTKEFWYSHDGVVMWGALIMLVLAQQVFGAPRWQRVLGPLMVFATGFSLLVSERRAGFIAIMVAFVMFSLILVFVRRKAFWLLAVPILAAGALYLPLFWNNSGALGQPARAVKSITDPDPRDAASNAWRDLEAVNVRATIHSSPIIGIGFGNPFLQVVSLPSISWFTFWNYWAHHAILWIWMKAGVFGFVSFFLVINAAIARAIWLIRTQGDPRVKAFSVLALSSIIMSVVFSYVDLGLTGPRIPIFMGVMLGAVAVIDRLRDNEPNRGAAPRAWRG